LGGNVGALVGGFVGVDVGMSSGCRQTSISGKPLPPTPIHPNARVSDPASRAQQTKPSAQSLSLSQLPGIDVTLVSKLETVEIVVEIKTTIHKHTLTVLQRKCNWTTV